MAEISNTTVNVTQPAIPVFKGENYEFWSIKMKTIFKSHGLWDLVETGAGTTPEDLKKDARALCFIQQVVDDTIFSKIAAAESAKQAWTTLKTAFQGSNRVKTIKLQGLHRDFETLQMKQEESVQIFLSRVTNVVNQIRTYGDDLSEQTVVAKVLRSLTPKFDHVVAAIEESKDLSAYTFDELMGSLQTHETRLSKSEERIEEKAFYTKGESTVETSFDQADGSSRGRGNSGRGRGRGRSNTGGRGRGNSKRDI
jgi:gag-polypeptide of LTR copia-type